MPNTRVIITPAENASAIYMAIRNTLSAIESGRIPDWGLDKHRAGAMVVLLADLAEVEHLTVREVLDRERADMATRNAPAATSGRVGGPEKPSPVSLDFPRPRGAT